MKMPKIHSLEEFTANKCSKNPEKSVCSFMSKFLDWMKSMGNAAMRRSSISFVDTLSYVHYLTTSCCQWQGCIHYWGANRSNFGDEMKRCLHVAMLKWRDLQLSIMKMPKIRSLEDHLIAMMEQWNGIDDFLEDFIGQAHQFGMKEEKHTANMRDRARATNSHAKWEWAD
jgi:hypothetical protein